MLKMTGAYFKTAVPRQNRQRYKLLGYWLSAPGNWEQAEELKLRLEDVCLNYGHNLCAMECEQGTSQDYLRRGLWTALRQVVCSHCPPKSMSFRCSSFDDFIAEALSPCPCKQESNLDGIIFASLVHYCSEPAQQTKFVLRMAEIGKHVIASDGICLSCCHPATKQFIEKRNLLVAS